jgi:DNA replication protein DnaC
MNTGHLEEKLRSLRLSGMLDTLEVRLAQARAGELGHLEFLEVLLEDEIARRGHNALLDRIRRARFEEEVTLEDFNFSFNPGVPAGLIRDLATLRFLERRESVLLCGLVGKTHVAQALGHLACRRGHTVLFSKTSRALAELAGGRAEGNWEQRLKRFSRPDLLILDDFGLRAFSASQGDDFYELVTERHGRSLVLTSNRYPQAGISSFPTRSWPRVCSTVWSTPPTTWSWRDGATAVTAGVKLTPIHHFETDPLFKRAGRVSSGRTGAEGGVRDQTGGVGGHRRAASSGVFN